MSDQQSRWRRLRTRLEAFMPIIVLISVIFSFVAFAKATQVSNRQIAQQKVELEHQADNQQFLTDTFCGFMIPISQIVPSTQGGVDIRNSASRASLKLNCNSIAPTTIPPQNN